MDYLQLFGRCAPLARRFKLLFALGIAGCCAALLARSLSIDLPGPENPVHFYANQRNDDLKYLYSKAIASAKDSLYAQVYSLSDPDILKLLDTHERHRLPLRIFYDPKANEQCSYHFKNHFPVHSSGLMHRKILVVDHSAVFIGTANFTKNSLELHDNLVVGLHAPALAAFIEQGGDNPCSLTIGENSLEMWMLPDPSAVQRIIQCLDQAQEQITIALFTLTHPLLVQAVQRAHARGVSLTIILDAYASQGASAQALKVLEEAGIPVRQHRGKQLLHHKWAWIDRTTFIVGSANWTDAAFNKNQDCFIIMAQLTRQQNKWLKKLQRTLIHESSLGD